MKQAKERFDVAYLGIWPITHKSEGLNVLLCDTIKPLVDDGVQVVVHTTDRHHHRVALALEGNGVDLRKVRVETHRVGSIGLEWIRAWRFPSREGRSLFARIKSRLAPTARWATDVAIWLLDMTLANALVKIPALVLFAVFGMIAGSVTALLAGIALLPLALVYLASNVAIRTLNALKRRFRVAHQLYVLSKRAARPAIARIVPELYRLEQERFARALNRKAPDRLIFFFSAFEGHVVKMLKSRAVVAFPDAVTALFPTRFAGYLASHSLNSMSLAVEHASGLVCYSKFVRDQQLVRLFGPLVSGKPVEVIPQGYFVSDVRRQRSRCELVAALNKQTFRLKNVFPTLLRKPPVVQFGEFDLILYPTIDRPHKNTTTLVRAVEHLIRRRHRNVKLLLTTPAPTEDVMKLITSRRLQYDVLFMPSVPIDTLDLLFQGASLMVHPSLAEGGDIFNFSRAVSVGVPALMANVPVAREMFEREGIAESVYRDWLFSPIEWEDLADKMEWALDESAGLVEQQRATLEKLATYDFRQMARRYHQFCMKVAST
jgi:glycosyltransferase involved in cell wall biosynthesis